MSQQTQFYTDLVAYLAGLVPNVIRARFYAERIPDNVALPAGQISIERRDDMQRVGNTTSPLEFTEVEFEAFGNTQYEALVLIDDLWAVLRNFKGPMGSTTITKVTKTSDLDGYEDASNSYYRSIQLTIGHR